MLRYTMAPEAVKLTVGLLEDGFELREAASEAFLPEITSSHIRALGLHMKMRCPLQL
jgi:hypothetical protein